MLHLGLVNIQKVQGAQLARYGLLYHHGGIYMDTDFLVVKDRLVGGLQGALVWGPLGLRQDLDEVLTLTRSFDLISYVDATWLPSDPRRRPLGDPCFTMFHPDFHRGARCVSAKEGVGSLEKGSLTSFSSQEVVPAYHRG